MAEFAEIFSFWKSILWNAIKGSSRTSFSKIEAGVCTIFGLYFIFLFQGWSAVKNQIIQIIFLGILPFLIWFFLKVIYYVLKTPVDLAKIVKKSELANSLINAITDLKIKSENAGEDQLNAWINDCNSVIEKFFGKDSYVHKVFNEKIIDNGLQTKLILHLQQKMLTGGKRLTRNISLVNDDKFAFKLICLDWIIEPFLPYTIPIRPVSGKK